MSTSGAAFHQQMFYGALMAIGSRIVERLDALKWRRPDLLARVPDLTPQALHNLIKRDSVRSEWDVEIARALGVSVMWLVYGLESMYSQPAQVHVLQARDAAPSIEHQAPIDQWLRIAATMSREGQHVALGRLEEIAVRYPAASAKPAE